MNPINNNISMQYLQPGNMLPTLTNLNGLNKSSGLGITNTRAADFNNPSPDHIKMKKAAQEFESVFIKQLMDAMDKTVDREDSMLSGGSAEEYFRGMLNEEVSKSMASRPGGSGFGLAETVYRQMAGNMGISKPTKTNEGS